MIDFATRSREATKKFLRTVVIVDDFPAHEEPDDSTTLDELALALDLPDDVELEETPAVDKNLESVNSEHRLNSLDLQRHFARAGLLLTVISAKNSSEAEGPIQYIRDRADVLILDWMWLGDTEPGDFCISQIKSLSETHQEQLVIIYTGNSDPEPIKRRIETVGLGEIDSTSMRYTNNRGLQVAVLQKEWANGSFFEASKVSEDALPQNVLNLFAEYAGGLLANAAMVALGSVRTSTHSILHRFRSELDPAYILHRAEVEPTSAGETHILDLISDSLADIVSVANPIEELGTEAVRSWLEPLRADVAEDEFNKLVLGENQYKGKSALIEKATAMLARSEPQVGERLQRSFSEFMYVVPHSWHFLTSGVIVSRGEELFVCVMPACDLERVTGQISVPFLKVREGVGKRKDFGFVMKNPEITPFHVTPSFANLVILPIDGPTSPGRVQAVSDHEGGAFFANGAVSYNFVTRLRPSFAQALMVALGSAVSRVGVSENEYERIQRK